MTDLVEAKNPYLSCFTWFEKCLASDGKPWLQDLRREAIANFSDLGLPTTRDEEWRYTSVAPIAKVPFTPARCMLDGIAHADFASFAFGESEYCQLVFIDGCFSESLSLLPSLPPGVRVMNLARALCDDPGAVQPNLARYAAFQANAFTALNTAFLSDGAFIEIAPHARFREIIHLIYLSVARETPAVSYPRNLIVAGAGSQVSVVESYVGLGRGLYFTNAVTEIVSGEGSMVDHYKLQRESDDAFHVATIQVHQGRDSRFTSHSISMGGALVRNDVNAVLKGEGADCTLNGLYVIKGKQHVDNHTSIAHAQPHCSSQELYKGILDGQSSGVFNGKILVHRDAQQTNARQTNKNLLLSEHALVNTKPQLEILANDVKCTHGATVGQLNREALFYLRSRGIDEASARALLTYAFASDVLNTIKIKPIQCQVDLVLLARLSRGLEGYVETVSDLAAV
jgi:Fe-S cluster assembly protein SufD